MFNFETIPSHENKEHVIENCMKKAAYVLELLPTCNPFICENAKSMFKPNISMKYFT